MKKYTIDDEQFIKVQALHRRKDISKNDRCHLSFTLAKIYEDIGEPDQAYSHLSEGNELRKRTLNYSIKHDEQLFEKLKKGQTQIINKIEIAKVSGWPKPIFIVGMPRSGTILVEQIISSHSEVAGQEN